MKEIFPRSYAAFHCIGGDCSNTCCQEWKITVDEACFQRWKHLPVPETSAHAQAAKDRKLSFHTEIGDGVRVIRLNSERKCPYLTENRLCSLVIRYGEEVLPYTCDVFPRQYHEFPDRIERSLVSCCPEAVDLLKEPGAMTFADYSVQDKTGDWKQDLRNIAMGYLMDEACTPETNLKRCFFVLLDVADRRKREVEPELGRYREPGFLNELLTAIEDLPVTIDSILERNELFLDLTFEYHKQGMYQNLLPLLIRQAEILEAELTQDAKTGHKSIHTKYRAYRESMRQYDTLFRSFLGSEIFTSMLLPESEYPDMVMMYEWITMEYAAVMHALFLLYSSKSSLSYEDVRDLLVTITRITGFDEDDISDYMKESFAAPIWEWGYYALVTG
jgi:lysine-N-methylase